jgi:trigger factor
LKFEKKELKDNQIEITVEVDNDLFQKAKVKAAISISKGSKIPGFRPGKATYDVVKRTFGEEMIEERAVELLVNQIYPDLLKEAEIKPHGPGNLEEIISKNPPKFRFTIPLQPVIDLGEYKTVRLPYKLPKVGKGEVEKVLDNLQLTYATSELVERAAEKGDLVSVKINAVLIKPEKDQEPNILKSTPHQVIIGEQTDEEQFPFNNFGDNLIGLEAGDVKEFTHKYSKDSNYEKLRGKEAQFSVVVESVKSLTKPSLDDAFAKTVNFEKFSELEESIQLQLETRNKNEYENKYFDDLLEKIIEKAKLKYPPQLLDDEIKDVLKSVEHDIARQNLDLDTYLKINNREKEEFIEKDIRPAAIKRLEQALVIDEISRLEKIELDQKELQKEYTKSFMQMKSAPNFRGLQKEFTTKKLSNMLVMQAASRLMNQRTLDKLKSIATGEAEKMMDEIPEEKKEENSNKDLIEEK